MIPAAWHESKRLARITLPSLNSEQRRRVAHEIYGFVRRGLPVPPIQRLLSSAFPTARRGHR